MTELPPMFRCPARINYEGKNWRCELRTRHDGEHSAVVAGDPMRWPDLPEPEESQIAPSKQGSLFDAKASAEARDRAIDQVERAADPDWKATALAAVLQLARSRPELTTDDVWAIAPCTTEEPRALGAIMRQAEALGAIKATERWIQSDRVACHRRPLRVWRSLLTIQATP